MTKFWHPFSNMSDTAGREVVFVRGKDCELFDREGNAYLDATASLWYCNVGHGRERIAEAMAIQAATLAACSCFDVYASDRTLELAERLAGMVPVDDAVVFFTSGGSDGIETAAKVVRRYWSEVGHPEKKVILARQGAYHGMHSYGTSLSGIQANRDFSGVLVHDAEVVPAMDPGALAEAIDRLEGRAAAFFAEPVLGAGGVHPPPDGYLAQAFEVCQERGVLFVADEVITGFGRTGRMFASERFGVRPDVMVLAKGLTSGYVPLGAVAFSGRVADPFWRPGSNVFLRHGYTYSGHAVACAAGAANLDILEEENLVGRVAALEPKLAQALAPLEALPEVSEVRTIGVLAGIQAAPGVLSDDPDLLARVVTICRERGVLTRRLAGDALQVSPPFVITEEQIGQIARTVEEAFLVASERSGSSDR